MSNVNYNSDDEWIPISDLMSGLMMVFLFIAIALMLDVQSTTKSYKDSHEAIQNELLTEFKDDINKWGAEVDPKELTVTFNAPDVLFSQGSARLTPRFKRILRNFVPRYLNIIDKHKGAIANIAIEGHTSSVWTRHTSRENAFFLNMALSQNRTRSVLRYLLDLNNKGNIDSHWLDKHISAIGYSSSHTIIENGIENQKKSRRVVFRIEIDSKGKLEQMSKKLLAQ